MLTTGRRVGEKAGRKPCARREEVSVTEADMPPPERPRRSHREGEQEHLREDAGMAQEGVTQGLGPGIEPAEHLREDTGRADREEREEDRKSLVEKAKDKLTGR
jgi:hypothetical protein